MHSPMRSLSGRRQASCVATKVRLFERLSRHAEQHARPAKQRLFLANATDIDIEAEASKSTTVHFKTHYQCAYGEQLKLVGNKEELGNWDVTSAPTLSWADGDAWTGQVQLGEADEARFKLVLLGHEGVVWEPVSDRVLDKPFSPQVAVDLAWGTEGVKVAADRCEQQSGATQSSAAEEFSALWDPLHTGNGGHEADTAKTAHKVSRRTSRGVSLEPEWDVLDMPEPNSTGLQSDATGSGTTAKSESVLASEATLQADSPTTISTSLKDASAAPAPVAALGITKTPSVRSEERGLVKKKKKSRSRKALRQPAARASVWQNALRNAQHFAVTGAAAAILSATGLHLPDVIMGSFTIASGAAILPSVVKSKGSVLHFDAQETVLPVIEGIGEAVLKTVSVIQRVQSNLQARILQARTPKVDESCEADEELSEEEFQEQLAQYVAELVDEATEFAINFSPSQEEIFEATAAFQSVNCESNGNEQYVSNIVMANVRNSNKAMA